ncbi:hypothetical protein D3C81_2046220 [compost metagenome]
MGWRQFLDTFVDRLWGWNIAKPDELRQCVTINAQIISKGRLDCFQLGGENKPVTDNTVIQGFFPHTIPG